jgi:hypothetical protein
MEDIFGINSLRCRLCLTERIKQQHLAQLKSALWTLDTSGLITVVYLLPVTTIV